MTQEDLLVGTALNSWKLVISQLDKTMAPFSDADLQLQIAPGKNRILYLVGHLATVHDRLFPMLSLGDRLHAEYDDVFLTNPDRGGPDEISAASVRQALSEVNGKLTAAFETLSPQEWLQKHTAVSDEDFVKEPLRNRLAVLLSRTNHASFHLGQIVLVKR